MSKFIISGFADEITPYVDGQIAEFRKMGLNRVVLRFVDAVNIAEISLEKAKEVKAKLDAADIAVSSLGSPLGKVAIDSPLADEMKKLLHLLDLAEIFETKFIRMFSFYPPTGSNFDLYADQVIDRLGALAVVASARGITLLHENEKDIFGDTDGRCLKILQALEPYGLRGAFDPANFVQCGVRPLEAFEKLRPYIAYMHIKDAQFSDGTVVPPTTGDGQIPQILRLLAEDGQDRTMFLSLEPHLVHFAGLASLEKNQEDTAVSDTQMSASRFAYAHSLLVECLRNI